MKTANIPGPLQLHQVCEMYDFIKLAHTEFISLRAYLENCSADVIVKNLPMLVAGLKRKQKQAEEILKKIREEV